MSVLARYRLRLNINRNVLVRSIGCHRVGRTLRSNTIGRNSRSFFSLNTNIVSGNRYCSWTPRLLDYSDVDRLLPWGFIEQAKVLENVIPRLRRQLSDNENCHHSKDFQQEINNLRDWVKDKSSYSRVGGKYLQIVGTTHAEFLLGATEAYRFLSKKWKDDKPLDYELLESVTTPSLAELLSQTHGTRQKVFQSQQSGMATDLDKYDTETQSPPIVDTLVIKAEMEEGRAHKPGQILGLWDADEFWSQLLIGAAGPEAQLIHERANWRQSKLTGSDPHIHLPHRLVVHALFIVKDENGDKRQQLALNNNDQQEVKGRKEEENQNQLTKVPPSPPLQCHVWEFETDARGSFQTDRSVKLQWRVRNINGALRPRAGRVLKSDGLVERNLGRWEY